MTMTSSKAPFITDKARRLLFEVCGYGLVSAVALLADMLLLQTLVSSWGWHYLPASVVSFTAGAAVAYLLSIQFVFRFRQVHNPLQEFTSFVALGLAGLLVNAAVLFAAVDGLGLGLITAKACAAGGTFATNFTLRRQLLFAPAKAP
jgi:putative flippase GtrA